MRLPLRPAGLHSDEDAPAADTPDDPDPGAVPTAASPEPTPAAPTETEEPPEANPESDDQKGGTWWATLWGKFQDLKEWAGGVVDSVKGHFQPD